MKTIIAIDVEDELAEKSIGIAEVALATAKMVYPEGKVQYKVFTERHAPFVSVDYFTDDLNEEYQMWAVFHAFGSFFQMDCVTRNREFTIQEVEDFMYHWMRQAKDEMFDYVESDSFKELFLSLCREATQIVLETTEEQRKVYDQIGSKDRNYLGKDENEETK